MTANAMLSDLSAIGRTTRGGYTRLAWDDATMQLREWFAGQASATGLEVVEDGNGNQLAWLGDGSADGRKALLLGSHLDSVRDGGPLDGPLGVAASLSALNRLLASGWKPARPIVIANFSDEEGGRFGVACLGSRLATGASPADATLALRDDDGTTLAEVMTARGRDPRSAGPAEWLDRIACFVELHVEQGRWLEPHGAAVGVASAIWPHGRYRLDFCGQGNHAGATAMTDRRDPMLTYAATVLAARELAAGGDRATFGRVQVAPGSTNSIPSRVTAWLDARAEAEPALEALVGAIVQRAETAARTDGTSVTLTAESTSGAVDFDLPLRHRLGALLDAPVLATGAGHDAGVLAARLPTAMLFVRNPSGISHAPEEFAEPIDIDAGVDALVRVIEELG